MTRLIIILTAILLTACEKENAARAPNEFEVVIAGQGMDCRLPLIDFKKTDLGRLEKITGTTGRTTYHAYNLNEDFDKIGQTIIITARKTKNSELSVCTAMGPSYPWVTSSAFPGICIFNKCNS